MIQAIISSLKVHAKKFPLENDYVKKIILLLEKSKEKSFHNYHWDDGHVTASMLVMNREHTHVLLMFHKKLQRWLQFGGHSDDSVDILSTAIREFHEESGIDRQPDIVSYYQKEELPIFDVDIHDIPPDAKGRPAHKHYDIRFLCEIPFDTPFIRQESEVDDIRWFPIDGIEQYLAEGGLIRMIEKIRKL